ncbi:ABC transporter ATP-binding protein [Paucilactobacillus nenjiangensis]|uniref:ABC transporter ATP-binding protein n=1 Tax=Paucilactobacillus nenjiangensis TaxID=1296540 RepID=A0A5P1X2J5_9LACO|nr:ABC transporter ATP-binding protein [Paucilactobacillus nenjiangensis]QER66558.1 ABC transporter ATP-binding protein [Paucilactobacillus nenjiangensis]
MPPAISVQALSKTYPKFKLNNISFELEPGTIMGLIGRNGAGKTTILKSILNLVHPDAGEITYFGQSLIDNEMDIKQRIGFAAGSINYYPKKKINHIIEVTKQFYSNWDDVTYRHYLDVFSLDEQKTPSELSEGMKVKLNLTIALSHNADLLILDEPTSGLDPVSRVELLDVFGYLKGQGKSILFSTHITSDLDKFADSITYIHAGNLVTSDNLKNFLQTAASQNLGNNLEEIMVNYETEDFHEKLTH